jgi:hypothetical protein
MEGAPSCTSPVPRPHDPAATQASYQSSRLNWLSVSEEQQADFDIVTAEGDTVSLSSDYRAAASLATYEHLALSDSGYRHIEAQMLDFQMEQDIAVTVVGDLNPQELADIKALLADLGAMFKKFLTSGGVEPPGVDEDFSRLTSLKSVQAQFEYSASLEYLSAQADEGAIGGPVPASSLPAPAAPVAAAAQNAAPAVDPTPIKATPLASPAETAPIAERMTQRVKESGLRPHKFMRLLKKFLKQFLKGLGAQGAGDAEKVKRGESILEKFFDRVGKLPAESEIRVNQVAFEQASVKSFFEVKAEKTVQPNEDARAGVRRPVPGSMFSMRHIEQIVYFHLL